MTASSIRIAGHARTLRATAVKSSGGFTSKALGYVADCSCGWHSMETFKATVITAHEAHKVQVVSGGWAAQIAGERMERRACYERLLDDPAALDAAYLTPEQVQSWIEEL